MNAKKTRELLREKFKSICSERVNQSIDGFRALIKHAGDNEAIDSLMREIHTLKGELRLMGFADGGKIVHRLEDRLRDLHDNDFAQAEAFLDLFTEGLDSVAGMVVRDTPVAIEALAQKIDQWQAKPTGRKTKKKTGAQKSKKTKPAPKKRAADSPAAPAAKPETKMSDMVRVSGAGLDQLGDLAGDLFTSNLRLQELSAMVDEIITETKQLEESLSRLGQHSPTTTEDHPAWRCQELAHKLAGYRRTQHDRISAMANSLDQVLEHVRELRLLPVSTLFDLYRSAARELARERGKKCAVTIEGETTLVDRSVLEALNEVLLHLIRNAIDHGLEDPAGRLRQNKTAAGKLLLRARLVGDRILIDVEDDGAGIDIKKVKTTAVQNGLLTPEAATAMGNKTAMQMIFRSGFSTLDTASEISGRGVGMDVVQTKIQEFGGAIRIQSTLNLGTCFTIDLPTSIAINRVLLFQVAGQTFALLATFVDRVERISPAALMKTSGGMALSVDQKTIPAGDAADLLHLGIASTRGDQIAVVVVHHGEKMFALIVDRLLGERELTIKPLGSFLSGMRGVTGAAMQEDGTVILVLHAGELIASAGRGGAPARPRLAEKSRRAQRVLLVEDSLVTRQLEHNILTAMGLQVSEAQNGIEALELLNKQTFELIISDVEMPELDGYELTRRLKQDDRWMQIPVILVTTRGSSEDRRMGIEVGADAYIVKSDFKKEEFMETVQRFLP